MNRVLTFCLFSLSLISILLYFPAFAFKVVIDPGHGGADVGANRQGIYESHITLRVGQMLMESLKLHPEVEPILTRTADVNVDLEDRVLFAQKVKADLFLSIHANASSDSRAKGAEFYFQNQLEMDEAIRYLAHQENQMSFKPSSQKNHALIKKTWSQPLKTIFMDLLDQARIQKSFTLSRKLRENWEGHQKPKSLSIKQAPFRVVSQTAMPSTLVELGYLTNSSDLKSLQSDDYLQTIVDSLTQGLLAFKEDSENESQGGQTGAVPLQSEHASR